MNHSFTCMVVGPTKTGKTVFVKTLIENKDKMINQPIDKVLWLKHGMKIIIVDYY